MIGRSDRQKADEHLILGLMQINRQCALARLLLICVDGFIAYVQAVQLVFRSPLPNGKRGHPCLIPWSDVHICQAVKRYQGKQVVDFTRRIAHACLKAAQVLLAKSHSGTELNTAFIKQLNVTLRSRLAVLIRRLRGPIRSPQTLEPLMYLVGSVYNFCTEYKCLRLKLSVGNPGSYWVQ